MNKNLSENYALKFYNLESVSANCHLLLAISLEVASNKVLQMIIENLASLFHSA